jgi:small subunit ribosomal protein S2
MSTAQIEKNNEAAQTDQQVQAKLEEAKALLKKLVEAGVHLGHETKSWNPKMAEYIFEEKNGLHIINLSKTVNNMMHAAEFLRKEAKAGRNILFVGTSKQSSEIIRKEAERAGVHYINQRWLGGLITNFDTIRARLNKLRELEHQKETGVFKSLGKKEIARLNRQINKLNRSLGGLKKMRGRPETIFVVDQNKDSLAITESTKLGIKLIAITDTDCDPGKLDYVIPGNNDSMKSVEVITQYFVDAILAGKSASTKKY